MKNTTTRLISIAGVLVLSAFAIVLAQHDSRQESSNLEVTPESGQEEQLEPIDVGMGDGMLVRANNDELIEQAGEFAPLPDMTGEVWQPPRSQEPSLPNMPQNPSMADASNDLAENPLRLPIDGTASPQPMEQNVGAPAPLPNLSDLSEFNEESAVVPAASEGPARPAWANDPPPQSPSLPSIPPPGQKLPSTNQLQPVPAMPTVPSGSPGPSTSGSDGEMPRFPLMNAPPSQQPANQAPSLPRQEPGTKSVVPLPALPAALPPAIGAPPAGAPATIQSPPQDPSTSRPPWPQENAPQQPAPPYSNDGAVLGTPRQLPNTPVIGGNPGQNAQPNSMQNPIPQDSGRAIASLASAQTRADLVSNQPGNRYLDGSQNPNLTIQKKAPAEIQVGKQANFVITVRNVGNATAHGVTVVDSVPRGCKFVNASPSVRPDVNGMLRWEVGEMSAGDERTISVQLIPEIEGEIGSVASVHMAAQASVRTVATLPNVQLQITSEPSLLIGSSQIVNVTLTNTGTGVARNVRLEADLPDGLSHDQGKELRADFGDLPPNATRQIVLRVTAVQPGLAPSSFRVLVGEEKAVQAEEQLAIEVLSPKLVAAIKGPKLRYLERQATFQLAVTNTGTAAASGLDFLVQLPPGLRFVNSSIPQANFDRATNTVDVGLPELGAGQTAPFEITVLPVDLGPQVIRLKTTGDLGISAETQGQLNVQGNGLLEFSVGQDNGIVEVGATTTYSVKVMNTGDVPDKNVQVTVQIPTGSSLINANAVAEHRVEGNRLIFAPVPEIKVNQELTYRFQVQHDAAGKQRIKAQLSSENWPEINKEVGTQVYNDQN